MSELDDLEEIAEQTKISSNYKTQARGAKSKPRKTDPKRRMFKRVKKKAVTLPKV